MQATTYSTHGLAHAAGITYRQCDYWLRRGVLATVDGRDQPGSGGVRHFDETEVRVAVVARRLAELGCPLGTLKGVCARLRDDGWPDAGLLFVRPDGTLGDRPAGSGWCVDLADLRALAAA